MLWAVAYEFVPFVKNEVERISLRDSFSDSVLYFTFQGLKSAEKFVPDDEDHRKIFVDVLWIWTMMHPVMSRCYKNMLKKAIGDVPLRM